VDASADDLEEREAAVEAVLGEIGAAERPRVVVLNKRDRIAEERGATLQGSRPGSVLVSAVTGEGLPDLQAVLAARLELVPQRVRLRFAAADARGIGGVYAAGKVITHEVFGDEVQLTAELPSRLIERYRERLL
jgi:GTP-binding protein HflX